MPNNRIIVIDKNSTPTGEQDYFLYVPNFKEYTQAVKTYPATDNREDLGYDLPKYLTAFFLRENQDDVVVTRNCQDVISKINELSLKDTEFLVRVFRGLTDLSQELQSAAEELADSLFEDRTALTYAISKDELPQNSADIIFNRAQNSVFMAARKSYASSKINGCDVTTWIAAYFITSVAGNTVPEGLANILDVFAKLEVMDVLFLTQVFLRLSLPSQNHMDLAEKKAQEFLQSLKTITPKSKGTAKQSATTDPT